jgi:phage terminase small subunit
MAELTQKQENFCLAYVETGNASEAYRRAYDAENMSQAVISNKASLLLARGDIGVKVAELRQPVIEAVRVTLAAHLTRLEELSFGAEQAGQFSAAINAEIARGKASGIYTEKPETPTVQTYNFSVHRAGTESRND